MTADTAASLVDHLKALLARVPEGTTPGPWMWWTSNSWRRLHHEERGLRTSVLEPFVARDGHPDCSVSRDDMALIELARDIAAALRTAIATISDLTREREAAREALRPFAAEADEWADIVPDDYHPMQPEMGHKGRCLPGSEAKFNLGDLRRARAALTTLTGEPAEAREKEAGRGR